MFVLQTHVFKYTPILRNPKFTPFIIHQQSCKSTSTKVQDWEKIRLQEILPIFSTNIVGLKESFRRFINFEDQLQEISGFVKFTYNPNLFIENQKSSFFLANKKAIAVLLVNLHQNIGFGKIQNIGDFGCFPLQIQEVLNKILGDLSILKANYRRIPDFKNLFSSQIKFPDFLNLFYNQFGSSNNIFSTCSC